MKTMHLLLLAIVVVAGVGAYYAGLGQRPPAPPAAAVHRIDGLAIELSALDLGEVWEENHFHRQVRIRNESTEDAFIERFGLGCSSCTSIEPKALRIPAGETATVTLDIDLLQRSLRDFGRETRSFSSDFWPVLQGRTEPARSGENTWTVRGTVRSRVTVDSPALNFGEAPIQGEPPVTLRVRARVHVPAKGLEVRTDASKLSVRIQPLESHPDQFDLLVAPRADLPPGRFQTDLAVEVVQESGERVPGPVVSVAGDVQPEVRVLPARLLLGNRLVGSMADEIVVLQAPPGTTLEVTRIETDSVDTHVEAASVAGSPVGRTFRVTQKITQAGEQRFDSRFLVRKPGQPPRAVAMEISYRGEPGPVSGKAADGRKAP